MRPTFKIASVALLAVLLCGCQQQRIPVEPEPVPQLVLMDRDWTYMSHPGHEIRTPHYQIFTTHTDPAVVQRLPRYLETAFRRYSMMIAPSRKPADLMPVYLFGERSQWDRFTDEFTGPAAAIYRKIQEGGYVDHGTAVFYDIRRMKTFAVTSHEGFHQYNAHYCLHRLPAWLDEGLACYFETFFWEGEELRFEPKRNLLRLRALRQALTRRTTLPLAELVETHPGKVIGSNADKVSSYYAQLWALMLFLQDGQYHQSFSRLLTDAGTQKMLENAAAAGYHGRPAEFGPAVFRAYFGTDTAAIEADFADYCVKLGGL